jgi:hypothetical protein
MQDAVATMGNILPEDATGRDAVHVAVFSAFSARSLWPGCHVGIVNKTRIDVEVGLNVTLCGIVDPFLTSTVLSGKRFWVFLYPRTITALTHRWSHPEFEEVSSTYTPPSSKLASERWLREFCSNSDCPPYDIVMAEAERVADGHHVLGLDKNYLDENCLYFKTSASGDIPPEFWSHVETVLGRVIKGPKARYFACSC